MLSLAAKIAAVSEPPRPSVPGEIFEFVSVTSTAGLTDWLLLALPPFSSVWIVDVVFVDSRNLWMAGFLACERARASEEVRRGGYI